MVTVKAIKNFSIDMGNGLSQVYLLGEEIALDLPEAEKLIANNLVNMLTEYVTVFPLQEYSSSDLVLHKHITKAIPKHYADILADIGIINKPELEEAV